MNRPSRLEIALASLLLATDLAVAALAGYLGDRPLDDHLHLAATAGFVVLTPVTGVVVQRIARRLGR